MLIGSAGGSSGANVDLASVFDVETYTGNGSSSGNTITNGMDFANTGGLVWIKERGADRDHCVVDTVRGVGKYVKSNANSSETTDNSTVSAFNSNGFTVKNSGLVNDNNRKYVAWSFLKAANFFDIVQYSGDSSASRSISHNLGSIPGMIIIKNRTRSSSEGEWMAFHKELGANVYIRPNLDNPKVTTETDVFPSLPTATAFTVGNDARVNTSTDNCQYIAYLFADTDGVIKTGSYSGSTSNVDVDCGFQPQFLVIKRTNAGSDWSVWDTARTTDKSLRWDSSDPEETFTGKITFTSTGFTVTPGDVNYSGSGNDFIFMAIADPS